MDYGEKINLCFRGIHSAKFNYVLLSFRNCSFSEHRHNQESVYSEFYQSDYPHRLSNRVYIHILSLICIDIPKYCAGLFSLRDTLSEQFLRLCLYQAFQILKCFRRGPIGSSLLI